jgi:F-box-like
MSTTYKPHLTYWERLGKRQTRNSQRRHFLHGLASKQILLKSGTKRSTGLPSEIWLLILQMMDPKDLQAIMRVNRLWYSEANRILYNKITNLLEGKGLFAYLSIAFYKECFYFFEKYTLPSTFEALKTVRFHGWEETATVTVISILEREGFDGLPDGVWRNGPDFLRACLTRSSTKPLKVYCGSLSKTCKGCCNADFRSRGQVHA